MPISGDGNELKRHRFLGTGGLELTAMGGGLEKEGMAPETGGGEDSQEGEMEQGNVARRYIYGGRV